MYLYRMVKFCDYWWYSMIRCPIFNFNQYTSFFRNCPIIHKCAFLKQKCNSFSFIITTTEFLWKYLHNEPLLPHSTSLRAQHKVRSGSNISLHSGVHYEGEDHVTGEFIITSHIDLTCFQELREGKPRASAMYIFNEFQQPLWVRARSMAPRSSPEHRLVLLIRKLGRC